MSINHRRINSAHRGFTLLELVIAMALIAMLSAMVFGIVQSSVSAAYSMQRSQVENDEVNRFIALCRAVFLKLPSTATVHIKVTEPGDPMQQELTIAGAPEAFAFGINPMSYKDTVISLRPDQKATTNSESGKNIYQLSISREDLIPTDSTQTPPTGARIGSDGVSLNDDQGRLWMPLLSDVVMLTWRAYKESDDSWQEEWTSSALPPLIEMNIQLEGRSQPTRIVFALPTVKLTAANPALAPKKTTTPATASPNAPTAAQGGANNGVPARGAPNAQPPQRRGGDGGPRGGGPPGGGGGPPGGGGPRGGPGSGGGGGGPGSGAPAPGGGGGGTGR